MKEAVRSVGAVAFVHEEEIIGLGRAPTTLKMTRRAKLGRLDGARDGGA